MLVVGKAAFGAVAQIGGAHHFGNPCEVLVGPRRTLAGVFVDGVVDLGFGQPQLVFLIAQADTVLRVGQDFQHVLEAHFEGGAVAQLLLEFGTVDPGRDQRVSGAVDPGDIGEVQAIRSMLGAELTIAHGVDRTRALRAAAQPQFFIGIEGQRGARVVHQVAAHHAGAVGQAVGVLVAGRHQQQFRAFDAVGGKDERLAGNPVRLFVRVEVVHGHDMALVIMFDAINHGVDVQSGACVHCGLNRDAAMVLRVNRANRLAAVVATAGRATVIGAAVTGGGVTHYRERRGQAFADAAHGVGLGHGFHRERLAAG